MVRFPSLPFTGKPRLKPLDEQVVVIIGASSGIGRESALQCAARGAKVVVAARSEPGLHSLVKEIEAAGGKATYALCDASSIDQVAAVADHAVATYGRLDTWVHAASVGVYATLEKVPLDDFRRVMDVNVMGYVHGIQTALPHLRREGQGAIIVVSSIESTVAMPLQSAYVASKHALEGLVETLRRELRYEGVPISVTSIKPAVISTPFYHNALSNVGFRPKAPGPVYHPSVVAGLVCYAAEHPVRDMIAGGSGRLMTLMQQVAPGLMDVGIGRVGIPLQRTGEPATDDALYAPRHHDNRVEAGIGSHAFRFSPYTWLQSHPPAKTALGLATAALASLAILRRR
jgi:NAD(P)-dependent dehydrogenase (short-subunit alcohol dehydrogenase family)